MIDVFEDKEEYGPLLIVIRFQDMLNEKSWLKLCIIFFFLQVIQNKGKCF